MNLSDLQRYILRTTYLQGPKCVRTHFNRFYKKVGEFEHKSITRSIERLIMRGVLIGYGWKTAERLFIDRVSLTPKGRGVAAHIAKEQPRLPLPKR